MEKYTFDDYNWDNFNNLSSMYEKMSVIINLNLNRVGESSEYYSILLAAYLAAKKLHEEETKKTI